MPFQIKEVPRDADFTDLTRVEITAFEDPFESMIRVLYPIKGPLKGPTPADREAGVHEAAQRIKADYQGNPAAVWLQMIDQETGKIVGGAEWHFYDADPYATTPTIECVWYPEGEDRTMANHFIKQLLAPRTIYMRRPHAFLSCLFTLPEYRHKGIGSALVDWGLEKADSKGLCTYVEASELGYSVYLKKGFTRGKLVEMTLQDLPDTPRRRQQEKEFLPISFLPAYRPAWGKSPSASDPLPWDAE